jgi:hypothetical protein
MLAKETYPEIWARKPEEDDTLGYLIEYFQTLRGFRRRRAWYRGLRLVSHSGA